MGTREDLARVLCIYFYFLTYLFKEKTVYLCIAMVPITMAAKILYCKDERKRETETEREREGEEKRVRVG